MIPKIFFFRFFLIFGLKVHQRLCRSHEKPRENCERIFRSNFQSVPSSVYFLLLNDDNNSNDEREYVNIWKDICICCLDFVCLWPFFDVSTLDNPPITVHAYIHTCVYLLVWEFSQFKDTVVNLCEICMWGAWEDSKIVWLITLMMWIIFLGPACPSGTQTTLIWIVVCSCINQGDIVSRTEVNI